MAKQTNSEKGRGSNCDVGASKNAVTHFLRRDYLHIFLLREFAFSDFYKLMVWGFSQGVSAIANSFNGPRLSQLLEDFEGFLHCIFYKMCLLLILLTVKFYIFLGRFECIFQVNIP